MSLLQEVLDITVRSIYISGSAAVIASTWSIPLTAYIVRRGGGLERVYASIVNTFMGFPTVLIGLLLYLTLSRAGPLGVLGLLYTPQAMIVGQAILVTPLIASAAYEVISKDSTRLVEMARTLGAGDLEIVRLLIDENRVGVVGSVIIGFQRAIGELGIALMLGGNIAGYTRVFTTAIALEIHRGEFELAISLGVILLTIDLAITILARYLGGGR